MGEFHLEVQKSNEPQHDKTNKMAVFPANTQISLGDTRMPRLIWVFAGRTAILLLVMSRLICWLSQFSYFNSSEIAI